MGKGAFTPPDEATWRRVVALADVGVMTASLLHELRQPLFALKAEAQLGRGMGAEVDREHFDHILEQVEHIEGLVGYYSTLGRDEDVGVFDLNEPVRDAVDMLVHRQRRSGALLELDLFAAALPVRGREGAARQVAINLLQNAFDAVEEVAGRRVTVHTSEVGAMVQLVVEDSGPGVPDDLRKRVFDPFFTSKPPGRGTGLGLYIARRLVLECSGHLTLDGGLAGGTRAVVELPRAA